MQVTLVFDKVGVQTIDKKHILSIKFNDLKRKLFHRRKFVLRKSIYKCSAFDILIDKRADVIVDDIPATTVFEGISQNTIAYIELVSEDGVRTVLVPSRVVDSKNQWQRSFTDGNDNLCIQCRRDGSFDREKEPIV